MTYEEEQRLHADHVVGLLNEISSCGHEQDEIGLSNLLGRCREMIKTLHVINIEAMRENRAMSDHHRTHFAGMALQALIGRTHEDGTVDVLIEHAYTIADKMVNYGKNDSKTKCTDGDTGTPST